MARKTSAAIRTYPRRPAASARKAAQEEAHNATPAAAPSRRPGPPPRETWKPAQVGFKTSNHVTYLIEALQNHYQMSKGSLLEMLVRERARELGLAPPVRFRG